MTNQSGLPGSMPAGEPQPNWEWLKERIAETNREKFANWLLEELAELEVRFEACSTHDSRMRALRSDFSSGR